MKLYKTQGVVPDYVGKWSINNFFFIGNTIKSKDEDARWISWN